MNMQVVAVRQPLEARRWVAIAVIVGAIAAALTLLAFDLLRSDGPSASSRIVAALTNPQATPDSPLPVVEPMVLDASNPDEARRKNAEIPFSTAPNPSARPFRFSGDELSRDRATDCLAAAMLYEAGDDATGEKAVGQVVLNRLRHPAFPKTVCGVVFQGSERATGCQFTFTCDGAMARIPAPAAWQRARKLALAMLTGEVFKPVGYSTHYHTDWVMPYWSSSLDKVAAVDTHLFFRWQGWWGTPGAFTRLLPSLQEPAVEKLALLSPAHRPSDAELALGSLEGSLINDNVQPLAIGADMIGKRVGPGKLVAIEAGGNGFVMLLDKGGDPGRYADAASRLCAGRSQCKLLAWTDSNVVPSGFPIAEGALQSMSFSYIRLKENALERVLYNCDEFPAVPRVQCMTRRIPRAATPRLLADEQLDRAGTALPQGVRPLADIQRGQLMPTTRPALKHPEGAAGVVAPGSF